MKKKKNKFSNAFWFVTYILVAGFLLLNIKTVGEILGAIFSVFTPFIYGFVLAYILSFPYKFFMNRCFYKIGTKRKKLLGLKKALSMLLSYILCFGLVAFLIGILVPQLSKSISNLADDIPVYAESIKESLDSVIAFVDEQFGYNLYEKFNYDAIMNFFVGSDVKGLVSNFFANAFPVALNFAEGLYNWIIGIIVSMYMLATKDKLCYQARAVVVAFLPLHISKKVLQITDLCNKKCGKFIIGKIIDSLIIGVICFIGLSIFDFDYPLLISVIVGVTNLIPFFGPFIGAIPCGLLLLLIEPMQCFWFIVFVIVLQQFDGNVLGPKIIGETVGISGFWILFSVIVGGGLFGLPGMLLGVPVFAVIYTLVDEGVTKRLRLKRDVMISESNTDIADKSTEEQKPVSNNE